MDLARALDARPYAVCEFIRRRCETVVGVATVAMPRTEGYQFLTLGQLLERAGISARLLSVWHRRMLGMGRQAGFLEWTKILRSASAYEAYLREHHAMFDGSLVIPFLLGSRELPRSVLYCLEVAERQLVSLSRGPFGRTSLRAMGRVRSEVEFAEPGRHERAASVRRGGHEPRRALGADATGGGPADPAAAVSGARHRRHSTGARGPATIRRWDPRPIRWATRLGPRAPSRPV
jgi:uncharacterized alpha-E superfamily protein